MSAATTAAPAVVRSSSRRQQSSYNSPSSERHHRTTSASARGPPPPAETHYAESYSHPHSQAAPPSQAPQLAGVARRDYETSNLARPPSSRRSSSRDRAGAAPPPYTRTESNRSAHRSSSKSGHHRYDSGPPSATAGASSQAPAPQPGMSRSHGEGSGAVAQQQMKRRTTIGTATGIWSLGKTIGAGSMGKVKLARNIDTGEQVAVKIVPRQSTDEHHSNRDKERADHSKEIRTAREAAIVTLLSHPYICGMRDVVRTNYHWYMLFEYVNGGQMLDYIISHGRLKEKQARKFGRQIASALDYCHRNSIVHRDLKIENILISKTGDIKIIDFGLSNLFSPRNHLRTFCGSLYFAAPELLMARQYTGPEVDIWSFGIVLYVLVCGKVPFDDQSMPQLHAKIKKGVVDYPAWITPECKNLISRMLVTDPKQRASLTEIMNHAWMTKGFNVTPENYLPPREPLQLPLDKAVIDKMTGFDFGSAEFITGQLTRLLESEDYQNAVRMYAREASSNPTGGEKKRGVFDFYKRRSSVNSRDTLPNMSTEGINMGMDPINAFSPLISIYYLVREKQEREKVEENPGALSIPISPGEKPLQVSDLPAPPAAYTNSSAYEMSGERPSGGRSRPRARTHGEDEAVEGLKKTNLSVPPSPAVMTTPSPTHGQISSKMEGVASGILRRFSTRRNKDHSRGQLDTQPSPTVQVQPPADSPGHSPAPPKKSFSVRRNRNRDSVVQPMMHSTGSQPHQQTEYLAPTNGTRNIMSNAINKGLGRSTSVNSADYRHRQSRRGVSEGQQSPVSVTDAPPTSGSDRSSEHPQRVRIREPSPTISDAASTTAAASTAPTTRSSTITSRAKSLGHSRRDSIQARRARREELRNSGGVPEETDQELAADEDRHGNNLGAGNESLDNIKPVYLKGLFSVSTTSSKPLTYIRTDIIRVLKQLGVTYTEIKGGFSCRHAPSIDLTKLQDGASPEIGASHEKTTHKRRISFGGFNRGTAEREREREELRAEQAAHHRSSSRRRGGGNPDISFTNSEDSEDEEIRAASRRRGQGRPAGETSTHVESDLGNSLVLRFEIVVVKVPLLSLHGIQFKKVTGGTWQYKEMAQQILHALRL